jgi:hypothetical protein
MHWFRKARYAIALVVLPLAGIGFATQLGDHSTLYIATVYFMIAGMSALTLLLAYADKSLTE